MIQSDAIRQAIRNSLTPGTALKTSGGADFTVEAISPHRIVLRVGEKQIRVSINLDSVNALVKEFRFLPPGRWMRIGATAGNPKPGTLAAVVHPHTQGGSSASQFAAILQHIKVAEVDPKRPAKLRLTV
ncbi:MAG: hypothetical protein ACFE89_06015 [Candidatus Hodarchaeota archaeon]